MTMSQDCYAQKKQEKWLQRHQSMRQCAVSWWIYSESWQRQPMSLWTAGTLERPVFPDAFVKIYLTASTQARAKRRFDELTQKGEQCNLEEIAADIESRDYADMHREISPLKQAEDAILVDTSDMNIEEVVAKLTQIIEEKKAS